VLVAAGMTLSNIVRLNFYTTDIDAFFAASHVLGQRLAFPELMIELEATAAD
jgi:enamine deaminase RidA (YjgF/YER057c/UK114 family)